MALLIVVLGAGIGGYELHTFNQTEKPTLQAEISSIQSKLTREQNEFRRLKRFKENIEEIKLELRELNVQLEAALESLPRTFNLSLLLRRLTFLAQNSGVELISFKPDAKEKRVPGTFYATTQVDLELIGSFTQTLMFFDQVTRLKRIINIDSIKVNPDKTPDDRDISASRGVGLSAKVVATIQIYRFAD